MNPVELAPSVLCVPVLGERRAEHNRSTSEKTRLLSDWLAPCLWRESYGLL